MKLDKLLGQGFLVLHFIGSQLHEGFHGHLVEMEVVFTIAPVDIVMDIVMDMFLPSLVRLPPVPGLLDQPALVQGDVVLSSVGKTNMSQVVLRTSVDEKEEAEQNEELHPCLAVSKVIRRRDVWSFILNHGCRHQTVPSVTRNVWGYLVSAVTRRDQLESVLFVNFAHKLAKYGAKIFCPIMKILIYLIVMSVLLC